MTLQEIFDKVNSGEYSHSRAYKEYLNLDGQGAEGSQKTTFTTFMENAVQNGWIQKAGQTIGGFLQNRYGGGMTQDPASIICPDGYENDGLGNCLPIKQGLSTIAWVGIGAVVLGGIGYLIYKNQK